MGHCNPYVTLSCSCVYSLLYHIKFSRTAFRSCKDPSEQTAHSWPLSPIGCELTVSNGWSHAGQWYGCVCVQLLSSTTLYCVSRDNKEFTDKCRLQRRLLNSGGWYLLLHSLGAPVLPSAASQGRSLYNGAQCWQWLPAVLCLHMHFPCTYKHH